MVRRRAVTYRKMVARSDREGGHTKKKTPTQPLRLASNNDVDRSFQVDSSSSRIPGEARRTMYRGIPMKSRLEARAAQWLDSAPGVRWQYEPVAYADQTGQYLPDFEAISLLDVPVLI